MKGCSVKILKSFGDGRGHMNVVEGERDIPFAIARAFYEYGATGAASRGNHANINSKFAFASLAGVCVVDADNGFERERFVLDNPAKILIMENMVWKSISGFSADNVLLVLSDCRYDANEYITDYNQFLQTIGKAK